MTEAQDAVLISEVMLSHASKKSSYSGALKRIKYHLALYVFFLVSTFFTPDFGISRFVWFCILAFGIAQWFYFIRFMATCEPFFSVIRNPQVRELKLAKEISARTSLYGLIWLVLIVVSGVIALSTELNIVAVVTGDIIFTIVAIAACNTDKSILRMTTAINVTAEIKKRHPDTL